MLTLLGISLVWIFALAGWGALVVPAGSMGSRKGETFAVRVGVGHAPVLLLAVVMHFFFPLAGWPTVGILLVGGLLGLRTRPSLRTVIFVVGVAAVVAFFASRATVHGDSGTYHVQAVAWMAEAPLVRGLANLFSCFGYNSSWWMLAGLMSWPFGVEVACSLVSIPLLTCSGVLIGGAAVRSARGVGTAGDWFLVPCAYFWLRQTMGVNNPAPATDIPANLFIILCLWAAASLGAESRQRYGIPLVLAALAATVKASALILVLILSLIFTLQVLAQIFANWRRHAGRWTFPVGHSVPILLATILVVAWMGHGVMTSGYPAWPSRVGAFWHPAWRVPGEVLDASYERARAWAFTYGADTVSRATQPAWKLWLDGQSGRTNLFIVAVAGVAALVALVFLLRTRRLRFASAFTYWVPGTTALVGLVWNLANVPALRFASGYAFSLLGCLSAVIGPALPKRLAQFVVPIWILLCVVSLHRLVAGRPSHLLTVPPLPVITHEEKLTRQGEIIYFPGEKDLSWLGPRPSTPEFNPELIIVRDPSSGRIREMRVVGTQKTERD
mgnify:CR=1 FL=1|jgi:hypothetical protein